MTTAHPSFSPAALKTPRAAAVAGILFALLYGASLVLSRLSVPPDLTAESTWLATSGGQVALALNMAPFAGIAFLWFIGVIRDRIGNLEDRFFGTVFLGSGLLFLALSFAGAAVAGGLVSAYTSQGQMIIESGTYTSMAGRSCTSSATRTRSAWRACL
jgi:hypothetical protein